MLGVALVSGGGTLVGCFLCARLSARIGRDMRNALYDKSLTFSASDFEGFGTGSMITRTLNDVNVVQQAFVWSVQMVLPVPLMCVIGVLMAFSIDHVMGLLLIGITLVVILGAVLVTRRASAIFARAQRFLDRISVVVRENITGARVIRAFNKAPGEAGRMRRSFTDYAQAAIQANTLFFVLESLAIFFLNLCVVAILWLGGNRIGGGFMEIGDITALTEYAVLILFYVMMAQMVLMLLPRAKVCLERIDAVLSHRPEITDGCRQPAPDGRGGGLRLPARLVPLCRRRRGYPPGPGLCPAPGPDHRHHRQHRQRQVHHRQAPAPVPRRDPGGHLL